MELFILRHNEWQFYYDNCTHIDKTPLLWEQRSYIWESCLIILLSIFYYILYIPCIYSFKRHLRDEHGQWNPCYVLMFHIGVLDCGVLWAFGTVHGMAMLLGLNYCCAPEFFYITGILASSLTGNEICSDVVLAMNRCVDILSPQLAKFAFYGNRIWLWVIPLIIYNFAFFFFCTPVIFNGFYFSWDANPYVGFIEVDEEKFKSQWLSHNELLCAYGTPLTYFVFIIVLWLKTQKMIGGGILEITALNKMQKMIFLQVFLISLINLIAGCCYFLESTFPSIVNPTVKVIGHFGLFHIHGLPPVIYLTLNSTVRHDARLMLAKIFNPEKIRKIHHLTVIVRTAAINITRDIRMGTNQRERGKGECVTFWLLDPEEEEQQQI